MSPRHTVARSPPLTARSRGPGGQALTILDEQLGRDVNVDLTRVARPNRLLQRESPAGRSIGPLLRLFQRHDALGVLVLLVALPLRVDLVAELLVVRRG